MERDIGEMDVTETHIGEMDIGERDIAEMDIGENDVEETVTTCRFAMHLMIHIHI
jgi:hypothetical protein